MTRWSEPPPPPRDREGGARRASAPDGDEQRLALPAPPGTGDGPASSEHTAGSRASTGGHGAEADGGPEPWLEPEGLGGQLHPAVIGVWSLQVVGALVVVAIYNVINQGGIVLVLLLPIAALMIGVNAVRWSRFRWRVVDGTLVISQGLIQRHRRVIPLERIQSVDVVRRVSHRLFRVEALQVEAIGGSETEGQLDALQPRVARQVRAALLAGRDAARHGEDPQARVTAALHGEPPAHGEAGDDAAAVTPGDRRGPGDHDGHDEEELARVSGGQLIRAGLTEANVTVLAAAMGLGWQLLSDRVDEVAQQVPAMLGPGMAVLAVVGLLLVALLLLIAGQLITYWNFRLTRTDDGLQIRRGLLEQRFDTIPLRRVQALRIEENLPRRLLGYAAVKADVAGKPGGGSTGTDTLLPFGTAAQARELVATILRDPQAPNVALHPMPKRARTRRRVRALLAAAVVTTAAAMWWGPWGLAAAVVVAPAIAAADAAYRALGWARDHGLLVARAGWWTRRTAFVPERRLQTLARTATVLQRWRHLGTVELQIARSPGLWSGPRWIDMDAGDADRQTVELAEVIQRVPTGGEPVPQPAPAPSR